MGQRPLAERIWRIGRLALVGLPLAALAAWSIRLVPQALHARSAVAHCETWVASVDRFQESIVRLQVKGFALHHGGPFGVEQASLQEAIDAYGRARTLLADRTGHERDPRLEALDQAMARYLAQLDRVSQATQRREAARGGQAAEEAGRTLSLELAHLSHQFQEVTSAYDSLETFHERMLESALGQMADHNRELAAFAGISLALALAFFLLGVHADTLKQRSEDSTRLAHALLDAAPIGILIWDADGRIARANQAMAHMLGRPLKTLQEARIATLLPEPVVTSLETAEAGRPATFNIHRPDGSFAALEAGVASAVFSGSPFRIAAVGDISRRLVAERRLQERSRQAELGASVGGTAKDLERLIHPILLAADILQASGPSPEKVNDLVGVIDRNGRAAAVLIGQLSRHLQDSEQSARPSLFELHACVWEAVAAIEVPPGLHLDVIVPDGACVVRGDRSGIITALATVLRRGAEAAGTGGSLRVEAKEEDGAGTVEVSDSGPRILELEAVFSAAYLATGQPGGPDLSNLPSLLQGMGGRISAHPGPSGQTVFRIQLPLAEA